MTIPPPGEVAINQRRDKRKLGNLKWYRKLFNWLLDITIGYGYRTWEALILLGVLYVLVLAVTLIAWNHHGAIAPVPQNATGIPSHTLGLVVPDQLPVLQPARVRLQHGRPDHQRPPGRLLAPQRQHPWGDFCAWVSSAGTVAGWLLVTLAVAGYTGLARRVDAP